MKINFDLLGRRNIYCNLFSLSQRQVVADNCSKLEEADFVPTLMDRVTQNLKYRFALDDVRILKISVNGSYPYGLREVKVGDVDCSVILDHPFILGDLILEPEISFGNGLKVKDVGIMGRGLFDASNPDSHPKFFSEVYSHFLTGISFYGGDFPFDSVSDPGKMMYAYRILIDGRRHFEFQNFRKAINRMIETKAILHLLNIINYKDSYADDLRKDVLQKEELEELFEELAAHFVRLEVKIHDNLPFDPPRFNFDDWNRAWKIIRNQESNPGEEEWIIGLADPSIIAMLAAYTRNEGTLHKLAEKYAPALNEEQKFILNILNLRNSS